MKKYQELILGLLVLAILVFILVFTIDSSFQHMIVEP